MRIAPGVALGPYELVRLLATGGMAAVWRARVRSPHLSRTVAIKLMLPELARDPEYEQMFLDEAKLVAEIDHPNIAAILDFGEHDGVLYQVMEWIDGEPLSALLHRCRAVRPPIAAAIAAQVAVGLHAAHSLRTPLGDPVGLVHRDVSPQNVMVGYDGVVKVVDFGVAKAATNGARTRAGYVKGKVTYMAPEQVRDEPVDARTDVFALGVVMYRMVTGRHPFADVDDWHTIERIRAPVPALPPRCVCPDVPVAMSHLIARAIAKDRARRFADMNELLRALEASVSPVERAHHGDIADVMDDHFPRRSDRPTAGTCSLVGDSARV